MAPFLAKVRKLIEQQSLDQYHREWLRFYKFHIESSQSHINCYSSTSTPSSSQAAPISCKQFLQTKKNLLFLRDLTMISLFVSWIHYLFCEFILNSLAFWRIHNKITVNFANLILIHNRESHWINNLLREFFIYFAIWL